MHSEHPKSPLAFPKWGSKTIVNYQRCRRPLLESPPPHPPLPSSPSLQVSADGKRQDHRKPSLSSDGDGGRVERLDSGTRKLDSRSRGALNGDPFTDMAPMRRMPTPEREREKEGSEEGDGEGGVKSEVGKGESKEDGIAAAKGVEAEAETDEPAQKPWNLRPRRASTKAAMEIFPSVGGCGVGKNCGVQEGQKSENLPMSTRLRGFVEGGGTERNEKRRFWIALSREEIEEDIYALTGSRPARRPRKRTRNVQKKLDSVFPGLWLVGVSPECYRVLMETPLN